MHLHVPHHPFQHPILIPMADLGNLVLILLGMLVALLIGPIHLD